MVAEVRAGRLDLAARTKFTADGDLVHETRALLFPVGEAEKAAEVSSSSLQNAADSGFVEVG